MNHKRGKCKNKRAGAKYLLKYHKRNGIKTESLEGEKFSDHRRRVVADKEVKGRGL